MSGRKNKNRQRGHQRGQSSELLDELHSLRDLLGTDDLGDIPLLDSVAEPGRPRPAAAPLTPTPGPSEQEPLDEIDLPILFSPVDEELPDDYRAELDESDRALLRPLQNLPPAGKEPSAPTKEPSAPTKEPSALKTQPSALKEQPPAQKKEQQGELFGQPEASQVKENPFLPAHIRARLTGGRVPRAEEQQQQEPRAEESPPPEEALEAVQPVEEAVPRPTTDTEEAAAGPETGETELSERELQRQQLIDRLVAKQLPELERQLRARIEQMVDELETSRG